MHVDYMEFNLSPAQCPECDTPPSWNRVAVHACYDTLLSEDSPGIVKLWMKTGKDGINIVFQCSNGHVWLPEVQNG